VHRDIKPENVMVRPDGLVKVLDFGLAKLTETKSPPVDSEASTLAKLGTEPGVVMGTVSYMSPEQARGEDVDHRSDIFSLGVTLYEMIAGCRPFEGRSAADVIASILHQEPAPIAKYTPGAPGELQWIVNKALRKGCDERYQTAKELLSDLKEVKEELEIQAKLKRRAAPELGKEADGAAPGRLAADWKTLDASAETIGEKGALTTSSARVILNEIKRHKRGATLIGVALILVLGSAGYGVYRFVYQSDPNVAPSQTKKFTPITAT